MNFKTAAIGGGLLCALGFGLSLCTACRERYTFGGRTVLITGGSRGLGLLISRRLAAEGARLALLSRNEQELDRAEAELSALGTVVLPLRCDIRKRDQVEHAVQRAIDHFGRIDVLINNAGIIQVGPLAHMTCEDFEEAMTVHFYGPLYATLAALPHMRRQEAGRIVNVTSIGAKIAVPHMAPYSASKFALLGLSDALRAELRRENILVTTVIPGPMRTGSPPNAQFKGKFKKEFAWFAIADALPLLSVSGERAAESIVEGCRRGSPRVTIGVQTQAAILLNELFPTLSAEIAALANYLLPSPDSGGSKELRSGWESQSNWAPSFLTRLSDEATVRNNERPPYS
jgi:NAD(P)-dependent dehydrogenase (short-subunit alcohol dehydrogenase family)